MGDLLLENTSYPTTLDTATLATPYTDTVASQHTNGPNTAIVAVETELGTGLKGTKTNLAERLAINTHADGGLLRGTSTPVAPSNTPHWFYNTATNLMYVYNTTTSSYDVVSTAAALTNYMRTDYAATITVQHIFNPATFGAAPFVVGANSEDVLVPHLHAAKLTTTEPIVSTQAIGTAPLAIVSTTKVVNLNVDTVDGAHASDTAGASEIPIVNSSGNLDLTDTNGVYLDNDSAIYGQNNARTADKILAYISADDTATYGDVTLPVNIVGAAVTINSATVWHSGNDGAGSGLDADTVDGHHIYRTSTVVDGANLSADGYEQWTVSVPGAAVGDAVILNYGDGPIALTFSSVVSATDTVRVTAYNGTSGAINAPSTTFYITVIH